MTKTSPWVLECSEHAGAFGLEAAADHIGFDPKATPGDGVMFIPDPLNSRGQREICVTDAAWARAQGAIRLRSKDRCEDCNEPAPNGDAHHICGRAAGKRDYHSDALLNLCRLCHGKAKILRRDAARQHQQHPHQETNHGEVSQRLCVSFERDDGNPAPSGGPQVSSMLDAA